MHALQAALVQFPSKEKSIFYVCLLQNFQLNGVVLKINPIFINFVFVSFL